MPSNADFVHLHCHSEFSRFDGLQKIGDFVLQARTMGFRALALTDHGNVGGWIKFSKECKKKKDKNDKELLGPDGKPLPPIKPILGCEFYLARDLKSRGKEQQPDGRKGNRHILLMAKNAEGYKNLCRLSQRSWTDGQAFSDPRIDLMLLAEHSKGLICTSACLGSIVNANLYQGRYEQAKAAAGLLAELFGDDFYLEGDYHGIDAQALILPKILKLGKEINRKVICANDVHYTRKEQARSQEVLMAMSSSSCIKDPKRIHFPYDEFYLKSADEMFDIFGSHPEMLLNTCEIADKVEDFLKTGGFRLPAFDITAARQQIGGQVVQIPTEIQQLIHIPRGHEQVKFLEERAWAGMVKLGWDKSPEHLQEYKKEMHDLKIALQNNKMDFWTYFLIEWNIMKKARDKGILTGPGRGSGYASLILRCLGVTYGPDPLKYGLLWERFLGFDDKYFISDADWGFDGEGQEEEIEVEELDELEEERPVEEDQGGVDRY